MSNDRHSLAFGNQADMTNTRRQISSHSQEQVEPGRSQLDHHTTFTLSNSMQSHPILPFISLIRFIQSMFINNAHSDREERAMQCHSQCSSIRLETHVHYICHTKVPGHFLTISLEQTATDLVTKVCVSVGHLFPLIHTHGSTR